MTQCWANVCSHTARLFFAVFLMTVASILFLIGYATPNWWCESAGGIETSAGLWTECTKFGDSTYECEYFVHQDVEAWFIAVQVMVSFGLVFLLVGVVSLYVLLICKKGDYTVKIVAISFLVAAGVFILIGIIVYAARSPDMVTSNYGYSFAFVVSAGILSVLVAIFMCIDVNLKNEVEDM